MIFRAANSCYRTESLFHQEKISPWSTWFPDKTIVGGMKLSIMLTLYQQSTSQLVRCCKVNYHSLVQLPQLRSQYIMLIGMLKSLSHSKISIAWSKSSPCTSSPSVWAKLERILNGQEVPQSIKTLHSEDQTERATPPAQRIFDQPRRTALGGVSGKSLNRSPFAGECIFT